MNINFLERKTDITTNWLADGFARRMMLLAHGNGASDLVCQRIWHMSLAVSQATADGHVCVPLANFLDEQLNGELFPDKAAALSVWRESLIVSGLCVRAIPAAMDSSEDAYPLVLDNDDRLYLARYYRYEARLAAALASRLYSRHGNDASLTSEDKTNLYRYFGNSVIHNTESVYELNWQMAAAVLAMQRRFVVLSGGPGTGKTTTVVGILGCLLERQPDLRVAMAAPTGKAAQRMQEAMTARDDLLSNVRAALPKKALTLHRLLGLLPETVRNPERRFRYDAQHPLPYDLIIIDEASMVDLPMATQLLEAMSNETHLVMLGDKDQLAAVEAGAVFAELSAVCRFSLDMQRKFMQVLDWPEVMKPMLSFEESRNRPSLVMEDSVVWLERNYRFGASSAIGRLATAIKLGRIADARLELVPDAVDDVDSSSIPGMFTPQKTFENQNNLKDDLVRLFEDSGFQLSRHHLNDIVSCYANYLSVLSHSIALSKKIDVSAEGSTETSSRIAEIVTPVFTAFGRFRVLCATRGGWRGVEVLNKQLAALLAAQADFMMDGGMGSHTWFVGRPVLITQNEYRLMLFNGDVGIALPLGPKGLLRVAFATADGGGYRLYSPASLPAHETAFAMTIHKSQGSEFERVAIVLPEQDNRILTRELVYTGITRARKQVMIYAPWTVLASALGRSARRDGGLSVRLREAFLVLEGC
ncbi:exodeoxyribonuclease V subunit alpha [Candidatus Pandoraea novymonadis]|uniref:RecBCD enzyme subunit RecD n=1 Tax=Candidatus Pandoraea novymonadis TaxID=1808959 RepID=A0ABX5FDA3_9BURK|nr:exodeoxyribonuclease V subunit alpha [Candidatus Pandoraea novymonadis]PSB91679.1 RecBCD enzyme subunit RecD [Candidatus Pandoraea novymonadis]